MKPSIRTLLAVTIGLLIFMTQGTTPVHSTYWCDISSPCADPSSVGYEIHYECDGGGTYTFRCGCSPTAGSQSAQCIYPPYGCGWSCTFYDSNGWETDDYTCNTPSCYQ
jgi:hypothetical protein